MMMKMMMMAEDENCKIMKYGDSNDGNTEASERERNNLMSPKIHKCFSYPN